ncbi:tetratricopeptide repeat protein [candidate division WOR-3 bacterium]|nr:tetratricopeptide repeat protein [candidate division WOR-3 bacterium]
MNNFLPVFISEKFSKNELNGKTRGSALFVDLGGFTKMTEMFFRKGDKGAEEISKQLLWIFDLPVKAVHGYRGHITTFAGDAFTAIFPEDDGSRAYSAASILTDFFQREGRRNTEIGELTFTCKSGVGQGEIEWEIIELDKKLNTYIFTGSAIENALKEIEDTGTGKIGWSGKREVDAGEPFQDAWSIPDDVVLKFIPQSILNAWNKSELRHATTVFVNLVRPERGNTSEVIRSIYNTADEFGGYLNKVDFGDKGTLALVLFGAPEARENPEDLALRFCVKLKKQISSLKIGVDSGLVYAGRTGGSERFEWTCLGNVVNTSARIMSSCKENEILVSDSVKKRVEKTAVFVQRGEVKFKGRSEPEKIYEITGLKNAKILSFKYKMVGRRDELKKLEDFTNKITVEKSNAGVCYIYGDAGIGKSRLVWELIENYKAQGVDISVMHLQCDETARYPWFPVSTWLIDFLNPDRRDLTTKNIAQELEGLGISGAAKKAWAISDIIGVSPGDKTYEEQNEERKKESQIFSLKEFVKVLSKKSPLIVFVDDLHSIDELTLEWLSALTRNVPDYPFAVVCTSRFDEKGGKPRINLDRRVKEMEIVLGSFETPELITDMFKGITGEEPSKPTTNYLLDNTGGNPFFLEQTIIFLKEREMLTGSPMTIDGKIERLPDSLNDLLTARLDSMDYELREIIKKAAVIGERFLVEILRCIIEESVKDELEFFLDKGEQGQIIARELNYENIYMFRHAMLREAAYQLYLPSERMILHGQIFEIAQKILSREIEIHTKLLLEQAEKAEQWSKWEEYAKDYVNIMLKKNANKESLRICGKLAKYYVKIGDYLKWAENELMTGKILKKTGQLKEAHDKIVGAIEKFGKNPDILAEAYNELGTVFLKDGEFDKALASFERALEYSKIIAGQKLESRTFGNFGVLYATKKNFEKALESYEKAKEIAVATGDKTSEALAMSNIGAILAQQNKYKEAEKHFDKSFEIASENGLSEEKAAAHINLGNLQAIKGRIADAEKHFDEALKIFRESGTREGEVYCLYNISEMKKHEDKFNEALKYTVEAMEIAKEIGSIRWEIKVLAQTGDLKYRMSEPEEALESFIEALKLCELREDLETETEILFEIAKLYKRINDFSKSHDYLEKAFTLSERIQNPALRSDIAYNIACLFADCGSFNKAAKYLDVVMKLGDKEGKVKLFREKYGY